jgi:hypothetical protein
MSKDTWQSEWNWDGYHDNGEPEPADEPQSKSVFRIYASDGPNKPVRVDWWTNDDEDVGSPSTAASNCYDYPNLEAALKFTGYTRQGVGSAVEVYLDDELLRESDTIALIVDEGGGCWRCVSDRFISIVADSWDEGKTLLGHEAMQGKMSVAFQLDTVDLPDDPLLLRRLAAMLERRAGWLEQKKLEGGE